MKVFVALGYLDFGDTYLQHLIVDDDLSRLKSRCEGAANKPLFWRDHSSPFFDPRRKHMGAVLETKGKPEEYPPGLWVIYRRELTDLSTSLPADMAS